MVLVLVLLPALAGQLGARTAEGGTHGVPWAALGVTLGKVVAFVLLMLIVGTRFFPWLLKHVEGTRSRELFTLAVIGLSVGVAFGSAMVFGVSLALGAFFAGVVVHTSDLSRRAANELQPLQEVFAALFFVAVGMLFDPSVLVREPWRLLAVAGIILVGKSVAALGIVLALGHPLRTGLTISAALAQIGEFSFILSGLAVALGLEAAESHNLVVAGAILSITLNPLVFYVLGVGRRRIGLTAER
jgi:CPA2 family monovalent cation:H+ antiporter-2